MAHTPTSPETMRQSSRKKLNFCETADSSEPFFSFSVLVAVLVNTATERDCPEQHPADTAGVRTDEHVKEQDD